ncbi:MAG: glutamate--cysteine ligase, partial [Blastocatellia bacterium]|nr:glutamate--cysteine ligase [Blastocatellia bacterium]
RLGLSDRRLHEAANSCVAIAAEKSPPELTDAMERLIRSVERGRCPGDDFSDQVIDHGIAATVSQLAQGGL